MPTLLRFAVAIVLMFPQILTWLFTTIRREVVGLWRDYNEHKRIKNARDQV